MTSGSNFCTTERNALSRATSELWCSTRLCESRRSESRGRGLESKRRRATQVSMPSFSSRSESPASGLTLGCSVHAIATGSWGSCALLWKVCMQRLITRRGGLALGMPISESRRLSSSFLGTKMDGGRMRSSTEQKERRAASSLQLPGLSRIHEGPVIRRDSNSFSSSDVFSPNTWLKVLPEMLMGGIWPLASQVTFKKGKYPAPWGRAFSKA
mmetsp:Transcript_83678/g.249738  ORF Transcript_83678/g.249738 Transcript_83678/m.249738 type:complete len:213 (-) Transcript_83678:1359-1997(-)